MSRVVPTQLTCQELVELVTGYLEGQLPEDERVRFEEHIGTCGACLTYLGQMRATLRAAGTLRESTVAPAARTALLGAFRAWKRGAGC